MPVTNFICPDKIEIPIGDCINKCRLRQRCLTQPTLIKIAQSDRPLTEIPSTTQMLNGPLMEWLKHHTSYSIDPRSRAFALLGTSHHDQLNSVASGDNIGETRQRDGGMSGQPDLLEPDDNQPGSYVVTDYKTYGSYRVRKILGLVRKERYSETEVYKVNSRYGKKGDPKRITYWMSDPVEVDMTSEQLQLNHYRLLCEAQGYSISRLQLQITVRDGGTVNARNNGIDDVIKLVEIPILPDSEVLGFFEMRRDELNIAMTTGTMPRLCNAWESWDKRRCQAFCDVAKFCPQGQEELTKGESDA